MVKNMTNFWAWKMSLLIRSCLNIVGLEFSFIIIHHKRPITNELNHRNEKKQQSCKSTAIGFITMDEHLSIHFGRIRRQFCNGKTQRRYFTELIHEKTC
mmetsp:Transcript_5952/g.12416  ORF Transcript_5952/g.12416 Transcript_5952/m.12416 type:complete len:99 (-) Transcript_5952:35-331(-)